MRRKYRTLGNRKDYTQSAANRSLEPANTDNEANLDRIRAHRADGFPGEQPPDCAGPAGVRGLQSRAHAQP